MTFVLSPTGTAGQARLLSGTGSVGFTDPCYITVQDTYNGRFLVGPGVGPGNWHPERHWFGPYSVEDDGSILLGTEIVNQIEEYTAIRISIGAQTATFEWPDTILPSPGGKVAATVIKNPPIKNPPPPPPGNGDDKGSPGKTPPPKQPPEIPWLKWFLISLILIAFALVALWLWSRQPAPVPPDLDVSCGVLTGKQSMAALRAALTVCGGGARADRDDEFRNDAFVALEDRERARDPEALLVFGHLYNPDHTDAFFEDTLGFTLGNDPANALRYYARAADAGHPGASQFVEAMCASLYARPVRADTDAAALQSHCPTP